LLGKTQATLTMLQGRHTFYAFVLKWRFPVANGRPDPHKIRIFCNT
jgi:hypothetical protein